MRNMLNQNKIASAGPSILVIMIVLGLFFVILVAAMLPMCG